VANNWTADRIASALLDSRPPIGSLSADDLPEVLGFLALGLVVPADIDRIPVAQIIDIRERYGAELYAFGRAVDEAAASMATLVGIRDQRMLDDYLQQVVTTRFAQPLQELRKQMRQLTGDAVTMSINVKTQLPAAVTLAGGAWLAGQPLLAGIGGAAIGLMAMRRGVRQQRQGTLQSAPAASFLLHTQELLEPRSLLARTVHRVARIAGTSAE
jgi:hypothetical protein